MSIDHEQTNQDVSSPSLEPASVSAATAPIYRISEIKLTSGTVVVPGELTVAIGPNNGGKSQFLRDLVSAIALRHIDRKSIEEVKETFPKGANAIVDAIVQGQQFDDNSNAILDVPSPDFEQAQNLRLGHAQFEVFIDREADEERRLQIIRDNLGRHLVAHLTTERRLLLIKRQINRNQNVEGSQTPIEAAFAASKDVMSWINERIFAAFETELIFDREIFANAEFRLGLSNKLSNDESTRKEQIRLLPQLDKQGDGIRSFSGILVTLAATGRPIIVIDEPEAFLHPPQAFLIGKAIAEWRNKGAQIFVATHSAEVLQGILSVALDTTIVRFSHSRNTYVTKLLEPKGLKKITDDPVLSSARVLDGLFYQGVSVVESDGDAVIYGNLLQKFDPSVSVGLINSYAKQSSSKVAAPFRAMGIPCAVLVDFDMLRIRAEFRKVFEALGGMWDSIKANYEEMLRAVELEDTADNRLSEALAKIQVLQSKVDEQADTLEKIRWLRTHMTDIRESASEWGRLKRSGIDGLPLSAQIPCRKILDACAVVGLFIVPIGEREAWLEPAVSYTKNKSVWTEKALTYLASSPLDDAHPLSQYIRKIGNYCRDNAISESPASGG